MSEVQPSVIEQLSKIHDTLDGLVTYEANTGGEYKTNYHFYLGLAELVYSKIQELKE